MVAAIKNNDQTAYGHHTINVTYRDVQCWGYLAQFQGDVHKVDTTYNHDGQCEQYDSDFDEQTQISLLFQTQFIIQIIYGHLTLVASDIGGTQYG